MKADIQVQIRVEISRLERERGSRKLVTREDVERLRKDVFDWLKRTPKTLDEALYDVVTAEINDVIQKDGPIGA